MNQSETPVERRNRLALELREAEADADTGPSIQILALRATAKLLYLPTIIATLMTPFLATGLRCAGTIIVLFTLHLAAYFVGLAYAGFIAKNHKWTYLSEAEAERKMRVPGVVLALSLSSISALFAVWQLAR